MIVISNQGDYEFIEGTKTLKTSEHPVFQAQIETHLAFQGWIGAPNAPAPLKKFERAKQSQQQIDLYDKELRFYLQKYDVTDIERAVDRESVRITGKIREDAFNG